jgi:hypothetical protein
MRRLDWHFMCVSCEVLEEQLRLASVSDVPVFYAAKAAAALPKFSSAASTLLTATWCGATVFNCLRQIENEGCSSGVHCRKTSHAPEIQGYWKYVDSFTGRLQGNEMGRTRRSVRLASPGAGSLSRGWPACPGFLHPSQKPPSTGPPLPPTSPCACCRWRSH